MSVDKFGRTSFHFQQKHGFLEVLHEEEEYLNARKRRIINAESPIENNDAATKIYVDSKIEECIIQSDSALIATIKILIAEEIDTSIKNEKLQILELLKNYKHNDIVIVDTDKSETLTSKHHMNSIGGIILKWLSNK